MADLHVIYDRSGARHETLVCAEHRDAIARGDEWQWKLDAGRIYLLFGRDLEGTHETVVERLTKASRRRYDQSLDESPLHIIMDVRRRGSDQVDELDLVFSEKLAGALLGSLVAMHVEPPPEVTG